MKAPSQMNLTQLREILQHRAQNKQMSKQALIDFEKAMDNLLKNKSDKTTVDKTRKEFRRIYKEEVYKK